MTVEIAAADVRLILDTQLSDEQLGAFIAPAKLIVEEEIEALNELTAARLKQIGIYLAAHFATMRQRQTRSERTAEGTLTLSYMGKDGLGLDGSQYGQQAKVLDTTGTLVNMGTVNKRPYFDNAI